MTQGFDPETLAFYAKEAPVYTASGTGGISRHLVDFADRLVPGAHAPTAISWAYENRTTAIRIPSGKPVARRIEHRVAGGDVNPYLMIAGVLGSALIGIEDGLTPPPPLLGNAYDSASPRLPTSWEEAIDDFETSSLVARIFPQELIRNYVLTKRQEVRYMAELGPDEQMDLYLDTV